MDAINRYGWTPSIGIGGRHHSVRPYGGAVYLFRGRRGDLLKAIYWDGQGLVLYAKRLEKGRFVWPQAKEGTVSLTAAQLSMLFEGIDWRQPVWTARPQTEIQA